MTLCLAWIRETPEIEELVFATDSTLTGGEKWNHGVKLFEFSRKDCLLCFAGETFRAYPLILNAIAIIKNDERLQSPLLDIQEVLYGIIEVFTELVQSIFDKPIGADPNVGDEAKFLFGGWSWKENRFRVWRISYSKDVQAFIPKEETTEEEKSRICVFLGDPESNEYNIAKIAHEKYKQELIKRGKFDAKLDMEPMSVLLDMIRDGNIREVDGAIQIGKIYKSGTNEFFGVMWPSIKGVPSLLGKLYSKHNKPRLRYYDPDTCEIIEDGIPKCLINIEDFSGSEDYEFLRECYSRDEDRHFIKENLSESEKKRLVNIFREHSYKEFLKVAEKNPELVAPVGEVKNG